MNPDLLRDPLQKQYVDDRYSIPSSSLRLMPLTQLLLISTSSSRRLRLRRRKGGYRCTVAALTPMCPRSCARLFSAPDSAFIIASCDAAYYRSEHVIVCHT